MPHWRTNRRDRCARRWRCVTWTIVALCATLIFALCFVALFVPFAHARDPDGRYAASPLHEWFDHLASKKGLCCSKYDGETVADADWDVHDGHYRVRLEGEWIAIDDDAVITEPNRDGRVMVWPMRTDGKVYGIRCFMPGAGT